MKKEFHKCFGEMDKLSLQNIPFFFMIDFLMESVIVLQTEELHKSGILIDFKGFKNYSAPCLTEKEILLKTYPETKDTYAKGFNIVQDHLKKGNSYLANYTRKTKIECNYTLEEIFYHAKSKYKMLYKNDFVFFSPETFVEIINHHIYTHPMKGTIDAAKENAIEILKNDVKEKAEHYTVVDLLRNDLSIVADDVKVEEFQRIDFIKTQQKNLYAMSSEISGIIKEEFRNKIGTLMKRLLPAGSILGAPKTKTQEIILQAENFKRGWYTGVSGWFDGANLDSCVMIRFIEKEKENLYFKSGGGITHLSKLADEYQEMKNKIYVPVY